MPASVCSFVRCGCDQLCTRIDNKDTRLFIMFRPICSWLILQFKSGNEYLMLEKDFVNLQKWCKKLGHRFICSTWNVTLSDKDFMCSDLSHSHKTIKFLLNGKLFLKISKNISWCRLDRTDIVGYSLSQRMRKYIDEGSVSNFTELPT